MDVYRLINVAGENMLLALGNDYTFVIDFDIGKPCKCDWCLIRSENPQDAICGNKRYQSDHNL